MEINGIAHIQLSVSDFDKSRAFYDQLSPALGMHVQYDEPGVYYCIGGRTGLLITPCAPELRERRFDQRSPGLHHLCFRARSRQDVEEAFRLVQTIGAPIVHGPEEGPWAPGYYSILFEDPDGVRLELILSLARATSTPRSIGYARGRRDARPAEIAGLQLALGRGRLMPSAQ